MTLYNCRPTHLLTLFIHDCSLTFYASYRLDSPIACIFRPFLPALSDELQQFQAEVLHNTTYYTTRFVEFHQHHVNAEFYSLRN